MGQKLGHLGWWTQCLLALLTSQNSFGCPFMHAGSRISIASSTFLHKVHCKTLVVIDT